MPSAPSLLDDLRSTIASALPNSDHRDDHIDALIDRARPAVFLDPSADSPVMEIGGAAQLPEGMEWPRGGYRNHPLIWVGMLHLDRLSEYNDLLDAQLHGKLLLFIGDAEEGELSWSHIEESGKEEMERDDYRVLHVSNETPLHAYETPADGRALSSQQLSMIACSMMLPDQFHDEIKPIVKDYDWKQVDALYTGEPRTAVTLFGWDRPQQGDTRRSCPNQEAWRRDPHAYDRLPEVPKVPKDKSLCTDEFWKHYEEVYEEFTRITRAENFGFTQGSEHPWATDTHADWCQLMQIDGDDIDMGDNSIHWLIRLDDLRAGRFDRVFLTFQCT